MKFFLDNCLSPRLSRALANLVEVDGHEVVHLAERFARDEPDESWIPKLGAEGGWVIISGDSRIVRSPHLRAIWRASGLTAFFLARSWLGMSLLDQAWRIIRWWPVIVSQAELVSPGAGFEVPAKPTMKFRQIRPA